MMILTYIGAFAKETNSFHVDCSWEHINQAAALNFISGFIKFLEVTHQARRLAGNIYYLITPKTSVNLSHRYRGYSLWGSSVCFTPANSYLTSSLSITKPHSLSAHTSFLPFSTIYPPHCLQRILEGFCQLIKSHSGLSMQP